MAVVQSSLENSVTALEFVPSTLHFTFLFVASVGSMVAVKETFPPTSMVCAVDGFRFTPVTATSPPS